MRPALFLCALMALVAGSAAQTYINGNNGCKVTSPQPVKNLKAVATSPTQVKASSRNDGGGGRQLPNWQLPHAPPPPPAPSAPSLLARG